jgi:hypothetical protein
MKRGVQGTLERRRGAQDYRQIFVIGLSYFLVRARALTATSCRGGQIKSLLWRTPIVLRWNVQEQPAADLPLASSQRPSVAALSRARERAKSRRRAQAPEDEVGAPGAPSAMHGYVWPTLDPHQTISWSQMCPRFWGRFTDLEMGPPLTKYNYATPKRGPFSVPETGAANRFQKLSRWRIPLSNARTTRHSLSWSCAS